MLTCLSNWLNLRACLIFVVLSNWPSQQWVPMSTRDEYEGHGSKGNQWTHGMNVKVMVLRGTNEHTGWMWRSWFWGEPMNTRDECEGHGSKVNKWKVMVIAYNSYIFMMVMTASLFILNRLLSSRSTKSVNIMFFSIWWEKWDLHINFNFKNFKEIIHYLYIFNFR